MQVLVLVEPVPGDGYRATGGSPLDLSAERRTPEEAVSRLTHLIPKRMEAGSRVLPLDLPSGDSDHPWAPFAATLGEHPLLDDWKQAMADYRRQTDLQTVTGLSLQDWTI